MGCVLSSLRPMIGRGVADDYFVNCDRCYLATNDNNLVVEFFCGLDQLLRVAVSKLNWIDWSD